MTGRNLEIVVLRRLARGPLYFRTLRHVRPIVFRLIDRGLVRPVAPPGGAGRNMVELTREGVQALQLDRLP